MSASAIETLTRRQRDRGVRQLAGVSLKEIMGVQKQEQKAEIPLSTASFARDSALLHSIIRDDPENRPPTELINEASSDYLKFFKDDEDTFYKQNKIEGALYATSVPLMYDAIRIWDDTRTKDTTELAEFMIDRFNWIGKDDYEKAFKIATDENISFSDAWDGLHDK